MAAPNWSNFDEKPPVIADPLTGKPLQPSLFVETGGAKTPSAAMSEAERMLLLTLVNNAPNASKELTINLKLVVPTVGERAKNNLKALGSIALALLLIRALWPKSDAVAPIAPSQLKLVTNSTPPKTNEIQEAWNEALRAKQPKRNASDENNANPASPQERNPIPPISNKHIERLKQRRKTLQAVKNKALDKLVNWKFLNKEEGGGITVPPAGISGVTLPGGVDLGQMGKNDIYKFPIDIKIKRHLALFAGLHRAHAEAALKLHPITLSKYTSHQILKYVHHIQELDVIRWFGKKPFLKIMKPARTALMSTAYQFGGLKKKAPEFVKYLKHFDYRAAAKALVKIGSAHRKYKKYAPRLKRQAALLYACANKIKRSRAAAHLQKLRAMQGIKLSPRVHTTLSLGGLRGIAGRFKVLAQASKAYEHAHPHHANRAAAMARAPRRLHFSDVEKNFKPAPQSQRHAEAMRQFFQRRAKHAGHLHLHVNNSPEQQNDVSGDANVIHLHIRTDQRYDLAA